MRRKGISSYFNLAIINIGIILTIVLDVFVFRQLEMTEQEQTRELGNAHLAWISQSIERYVNIADGMVSFVMREQGDVRKMNERAGQYFPMSPALNSIQLVPADGVSVVYPWDKDRIDLKAILPDMNVWKSDGAKRRQRTSITDIVDRENGEKDLVFIRPIYVWQQGNQENFWGFTVVDVSLNRMLEHMDLTRLGLVGIRYQLCWTDTATGKEIEIASNGAMVGDRVSAIRGIDGDTWTLYMQPINGWGNTWIIVMLTWIGLTITGLLAFARAHILQIRHQGEIDELTGAYNRKGGDRVVAELMKKRPNGKFMVIALDVDNFKLINDVYGHDAGDRVLMQFVYNMRQTFGDNAIVTRNGGDEFVIVCPYEEENLLAEKVRLFSETHHRVRHHGKIVNFHTSMGYAVYPEQGTEYKNLCIKADFALYNAKLNGKNGWRKYDDSLVHMQERFQLGFNLSDMTNHMPGAMIVYRADEERKILFASDQVIDLFECENWEDFMQYCQGSFNHVISEDDKRVLDAERDEVIAFSHSDRNVEFLDFKIITKTGKVRDIISAGNYNVNAVHGGVFYVSIFIKKHLRLKKAEEIRGLSD